MASMLLHCALLAAGNVDHWLSSCCCARCSSLAQRSIGCFSETEAAATAMSLQLRAISNFGTWSATATTKWELKTIIQNEIGISGLLLVFGLDRSPFPPSWQLSSMQKRIGKYLLPSKRGRFRIHKNGEC
jgi:hypothetical protein